jgi:diketogulonate reductase-like aldo/keto reductase
MPKGGIAFYLKECAKDVRSALEIGYRCLDSAEVYGNASSIQEGIKGWGGKREDLYIITKCTYLQDVSRK